MSRFPANISRRRARRGTTLLEVLISFILITTVLTVSTMLLVRHGRLMGTQRDYRLAIEELSNQLDRLSALPADELKTAMNDLAPSPFVATRLPGAELKGQLDPTEKGQRITLRLHWQEPQLEKSPVTMAAWVFPKPAPSAPEQGANP